MNAEEATPQEIKEVAEIYTLMVELSDRLQVLSKSTNRDVYEKSLKILLDCIDQLMFRGNFE